MVTKPASKRTASPAATSRRAKLAENATAFYRRAAYVVPKIALDRPTAAALRRFMKREGIGVSDAIRAAILAAGAIKTKTPGTR